MQSLGRCALPLLCGLAPRPAVVRPRTEPRPGPVPTHARGPRAGDAGPGVGLVVLDGRSGTGSRVSRGRRCLLSCLSLSSVRDRSGRAVAVMPPCVG
jgi:hypothetical protein